MTKTLFCSLVWFSFFWICIQKIFISWWNYWRAVSRVGRTELGYQYETRHSIIISKFYETIRYWFQVYGNGYIWHMWCSIYCERGTGYQFHYWKGKGYFIVHKSLQNKFCATNNTIWLSKAIFRFAGTSIDKPLWCKQYYVISLNWIKLIQNPNVKRKTKFSDNTRP